MILALETSTPVCSVALASGSGEIFEKRIEGRGVHSERTFLFVRELLERAEADVPALDAVLFSNGPGSYTGLRIGAAAVKGLLFGREVPLFTFPTLLSFAAGLPEKPGSGNIHPVINARRQHLYWQKITFAGDGKVSAALPEVVELRWLEQQIKPGDTIVGTGWERLPSSCLEGVHQFGNEAVSAINLIKAWNQKPFRSFFKKAETDLFEPDYITLSQINNTRVKKTTEE